MPLSDHAFNEELDHLVESTTQIFLTDPPDPYSPMLFVISNGEVDIIGLEPEDEEGEAAAEDPQSQAADAASLDWPALIDDLASDLKEDHPDADAVFFAFPGTDIAGNPAVCIHGATRDGRQNAAELTIAPGPDGAPKIVGGKTWEHPTPFSPHAQTNLALRLIGQM